MQSVFGMDARRNGGPFRRRNVQPGGNFWKHFGVSLIGINLPAPSAKTGGFKTLPDDTPQIGSFRQTRFRHSPTGTHE